MFKYQTNLMFLYTLTNLVGWFAISVFVTNKYKWKVCNFMLSANIFHSFIKSVVFLVSNNFYLKCNWFNFSESKWYIPNNHLKYYCWSMCNEECLNRFKIISLNVSPFLCKNDKGTWSKSNFPNFPIHYMIPPPIYFKFKKTHPK